MAAATHPASDPAGRPRTSATQGRALRARGQRTMRRLLDAGTTVFAERGYHAARVDDVVKAARTSHGTFYLYFASKEDLFRSLAHEVASDMAALAGDFPRIEPGAPGRSALGAWLTRFLDLYERAGPVIRAWTEAEISDSEFGRIGGDLIGEFTARLAARVRAATDDLDPQVAAVAIVALIERTSYLTVTGTLRADQERIITTLAAAVQDGVLGHGAVAGEA